jgi:hypothetical protein
MFANLTGAKCRHVSCTSQGPNFNFHRNRVAAQLDKYTDPTVLPTKTHGEARRPSAVRHLKPDPGQPTSATARPLACSSPVLAAADAHTRRESCSFRPPPRRSSCLSRGSRERAGRAAGGRWTGGGSGAGERGRGMGAAVYAQWWNWSNASQGTVSQALSAPGVRARRQPRCVNGP